MSAELLSRSVGELLDLLRTRKLSAIELMQATIDRARSTHDDLNSLIVRRSDEELLDEAKAAQARWDSGEARPLEGLALGVKDLEDVAGLTNSRGSKLYADHVSAADAPHVARLRSAGAIVIGKTNTPEFGFTAITKNLVYGVSRSPWNLERTPGGSSGGSAALIAAGVLPLVTASDGGGSIRIPASFVGAFGHKPSYGRVPRGPLALWDTPQMSVFGPLTRTVEDAALFLDVVTGPAPEDPASLPHPGYRYSDILDEPLEPLRIGYSADLDHAVVQSDVAECVEQSARELADHGGHRLEMLAGGPPSLGGSWGELGNFQLAGELGEQFDSRREDITRSLAEGIARVKTISAEHWGRISKARAALNTWCADVFDRFDVLITPTVPYDPPPARGPFPELVEGREPPPAGVAAFTIPFNMSWHPAATVRAGLSRNGLPIGLQIVGPRHRDDLVLRVARSFQDMRPWHPEWPTEWSRLS